MNIKHLITILTLGVSFANAQQEYEISFQEIESKYCRNCYGSLVVEKGSLSDTIFGGQWGNVVNYKLIKIKDKEYLNTYYRYGYPGGHAVLKYKIRSIEEQNFLEPIFEKSFELYRETHRDYNDVPTNYIFDRTINIKIKNGIEFDVNLVVSYCPEVEDEPCDQLFEESYIEFYKIN
jgi:hypothetical protein